MIAYHEKKEADGSPNTLGMWHQAALREVSVAGARVLDIGCGAGGFLHTIQAQAAFVLGVDPNPHSTALLEQQGISARTGYIGDHSASLQGKFDVVTSFEVIEHLYDPWELCTGAYEALVSGGVFVVTTPNAFHLLRAFDFAVRQRHRDVLMDPTRADSAEHIRLWSQDMLLRTLTKSGFKNVRCVGVWRMGGRLIVSHNPLLVRWCSQHLIGIGTK